MKLRSLLALGCVCVASGRAHAQIVLRRDVAGPTPVSEIGQEVRLRIQSRLLGSLVNPDYPGVIGSFGSYSFTDGKIAFAGAYTTNGGNVVSAKVTGTGARGLLAVLDEGKAGKDLGADLQFHFGAGGERAEIWYDLGSIRAYHAARKAAADSVVKSESELERGNRLARAYSAAESKLEVTSFALGWWTLAYGATVSDFRLFDPAAAYTDQIAAERFVSHRARVQYSTLRYLRGRGRLESIVARLSFARTDNREQLTPVQLTEKSEHDTIAGRRTSVRTINALRGEYRRDVGDLALEIDYYLLAFGDGRFGVHLFPSHRWLDGRPGTDVGIGAPTVVRNSKDQTARVNAELFFLIRGVGRGPDTVSARNAVERGQLGFRFTVPFSFTPAG